MILSRLQEYVLDKMAIPIWVDRGSAQPPQTSVDAVNTPAQDVYLAAECLILLDDKIYTPEAKRLLDAMLFSIALNADKVVLVTLDQIAALKCLILDKKVLFVLGQSALDKLKGNAAPISDYRGTAHTKIHATLKVIVSIGLDEVLASPAKKALVWQDLQLLKTTHQALLSA